MCKTSDYKRASSWTSRTYSVKPDVNLHRLLTYNGYASNLLFNRRSQNNINT